jgi:hypothetical protein
MFALLDDLLGGTFAGETVADEAIDVAGEEAILLGGF